MIAVRDEFITNEKETLQAILEVINTITAGFKQIPEIDAIISERYQQKNEDVKNWLELTEWSQKNIEPSTVEAVQNQLLKLDIISEKLPYNQLVANSRRLTPLNGGFPKDFSTSFVLLKCLFPNQ